MIVLIICGWPWQKQWLGLAADIVVLYLEARSFRRSIG
jgi:hypothetical protein